MSQPRRNPCNSLANCRAAIETIEYKLDTTRPSEFSGLVLQSYLDTILAAIKTIRATDITPGREMTSKDGALNYLRKARGDMDRAISLKKSMKAVTRQYTDTLESCRQALADALSQW